MPSEPAHRSAPLAIVTTPTSLPPAPPWTGEALLLLWHARATGVWDALVRVLLARGRAGTFVACDFLLARLLYGNSGVATIESFFVTLGPFATMFAVMGGRRALPSRSALLRWLSDVTTEALESIRAVLFRDLLAHGLRDAQRGQLVDRTGASHVVFDVDGTRQTARQRSVVGGDERPPVRRRATRSCAPGYTGRRRGEVVRTRTVVQQAHTREWLGTFGHAGNGDARGEFDRALDAIARYLAAHDLPASTSLVRLDGLYGRPWATRMLVARGLGYVGRCVDYALLEHWAVRTVLAHPPIATFRQPDTGTEREVFEVPQLARGQGADAPVVRLIVTRRRMDRTEPRKIGVRQGPFVYELFVTDRRAPGLVCTDVLSLYFARGAFEQTLADEDREGDPDRCTSQHPEGQEAWQCLMQWVWNARLRLGAASNDNAARPRTTIWSEALPPLPVPDHAGNAPHGACARRGEVCATHGRGSGRYGPEHFCFRNDRTLCYPAGARLRPVEQRPDRRGVRVVHAASVTDCVGCGHAPACRGHDASLARGRRVSVIFAAKVTGHAVERIDVAARARLRGFLATFARQRVEIGPAPRITPPAPRATDPRSSLASRAHLARPPYHRYVNRAGSPCTACPYSSPVASGRRGADLPHRSNSLRIM